MSGRMLPAGSFARKPSRGNGWTGSARDARWRTRPRLADLPHSGAGEAKGLSFSTRLILCSRVMEVSIFSMGY